MYPAGKPMVSESRDSVCGFCGQTAYIGIPASPAAGCVVLGKGFNLSGP